MKDHGGNNEDAYAGDGRPTHPFLEASLISKILFIWPYQLMNKKKKGDKNAPAIKESDLPNVLDQDTSEENLRKFQELWQAEKDRAAKVAERAKAKAAAAASGSNGDKGGRGKGDIPVVLPKGAYPSLHRAIITDFFSTMWFVQPFMCASSAAKLVQALALGYLLQSFEADAEDLDEKAKGKGYLWAGILVLSGFVVLMEHHHVFFWTWRKGMQYRIASIAAIYDKSLRLKSTSTTDQLLPSSSTGGKSSTTSATASSGKIVNIATNDVERFLLASLFASYIIWAPLQSFAILGLGWHVIGWSFAAGFGVLIFILVPLQLWLSKKFAMLRTKIAAITDERVTLVSQAVSGVRVMKMAGWEDNFEDRIAKIRKAETDQIERVNRYRALNEAIFYVSNVTTSVLVFLIHVGSGGVLTPRNVFTTMVLMNVAQLEITKHLSLAVMGVSECWVSIGRIQKFLESPELEINPEVPLICDDNPEAALQISNATCHWNGSGTRSSSATVSSSNSVSDNGSADVSEMDTTGLVVAVNDVNLDFDMSQLTCIIGEVGSGKSALIQMLAGELPLSKGALKRKAGTSLAYAPQDPWIMDGTVKENILLGRPYDEDTYERIIVACGLSVDFAQLRDGEDTIVGDRGVQLSGGQRARIALARAFYRDADILLLDDPLSAVDSKVGRLLFYSAIIDLGINRGKCVILVTHQHQFIGSHRCIMMKMGQVACVGSYQECVSASDGKMNFATQNNETDEVAPQDRGDGDKKPSADTETIQVAQKKVTGDQDDQKEQSLVGTVRMETFLSYLKAMPGGEYMGIFMFFLFVCTQATVLACIAAVGKWSVLPADDQLDATIIGVVVGLVSMVICLAVFRAFWSFHLTIQASRKLHDDMTRSVLRAKIEFFDTNPLGRILNRFSSDVGSNDDLLPTTLFDFLVIAFLVLGSLVSAVTVLPVTLVAIPPLVWYFIRVRRIFVTTSRELKRIEGLARSPIFAMLSESLSGIATIRSNDALDYFKKKFREVHDAHGRAFFAFIGTSRWLGFRMDSLMFIFLAIASFAAVVVQDKKLFNIDPGVLGLALSMLIMLSGLFQWCIRQSAEVVNQMVSVERVIGFRDLPSEAALSNNYDNDVVSWPSSGGIEVQDLCVRYRSGLPLSLKGLSFKIDGGSRVGVVGRTGGGKSTLVQSLLRLLEAENGHILIDDVDISRLGLHKLRNAISVIPQSPVLYGGCSLRVNLDPFQEYSDGQILDALSDVSMLDAIEQLPHRLETTVADGGQNFSVGQRQLLCLARAILRRSKILVLDEPTANVDSRTDKLLQEAVAKSFEGATIIAVAHRLDTIINYDKVIVLGSGGLLEFGSPHELIQKGEAFASMIDDTGKEMSAKLRAQASCNCS